MQDLVSVAGALTGPAREADHEQDLLFVSTFVESIDVHAPMNLSQIRNVVCHFDRLKTKLLSQAPSRDDHFRKAVQRTAKALLTKVKILDQLAAQKESEGEVDDGGDILPSERDKFCTTVDQTDVVADDFRMGVKRLCSALDALRAAVLTGKDTTEAMYGIHGCLLQLKVLKDYDAPGVLYSIGSVLAEESRWVTKRLGQRPGTLSALARSVSSLSGAGPEQQWLDVWMGDATTDPLYAPRVADERLEAVRDIVDKIHPDEQTSLSEARNSFHTLEACKGALMEVMAYGNLAFHESAPKLLRVMKQKSEAIAAAIEQMVAVGEVDIVMELPASERDNICKNLDEYDDIPLAWRRGVKGLCDMLDTLRETALLGGDVDVAMAAFLGRMDALKRSPGYQESYIAAEVQNVIAEEFRCILSQNGYG